MSKVNVVRGACWIWTAQTKHGYGRFFLNGRKEQAHRVSYMIYVNEVPRKLCVLHKCDNPPCVNPEHLFLGTMGDNNKDRDLKGRCASGAAHYNSKKTHCPRGHLYSNDNIYFSMSSSGRRARSCIKCSKERYKKKFV